LLPELDLAAGGEANDQTRDDFAAEAASIVARQRRLIWLAPSRDESADGPVLTPEAVEIWAASESGQPDDEAVRPNVQGGRERGLILHKLLEEVLTSETPDDAVALSERARALIGEIGRPVMADPSQGLSPDELAGCVVRTLALPEIAELRPTLVPELAVYAVVDVDGVEQATVGIADATSFDNAGRPTVVVDWKSDVQPSPAMIDHYRAQVGAYLDMTSADRGMIVFMTSGESIAVPSGSGHSA
jgi:hypothetical protein